MLPQAVSEVELNELPGQNAVLSLAVSPEGEQDDNVQHQPPTSPASSTSCQQRSPQAPLSPQSTIQSEDICNAPRTHSLPSDGRFGDSLTLVASSQFGESTSQSGENGSGRSSLLRVRTWSHCASRALNTQTLLAWSLAALTIATVVYSIRADALQRYQNRVAFIDHCRSVDFAEAACVGLEDAEAGPPPFSVFTEVWRKLNKRAEPDLESYEANITDHAPSNDQNSKMPLAELLVKLFVVLGTLLFVAAYIIYGRVMKRRDGETKQSDMSMARQELTRLTNAICTGSETESNDAIANSQNGRYRAFLPAEDAINKLKYATSSQTDFTTPDSRRSSNPWGRRGSRLTISHPSLLEHAQIYYYNAGLDTPQWEKVKHYCESSDTAVEEELENSTPVLRRRLPTHNELPTPPPTPPPPQQQQAEGDTKGPMEKLRHLLKSKHLTDDDDVAPEHNEADFRAALAFVGAIAGATTGGSAMSRCPVEVTPNKGLSHDWMHGTSQEDMPSVKSASHIDK